MTSKLDRAAVYADLRMAIARVAGAPVESIDQDTLLRDELGFDSLTAVELLIEIEDRWAVVLPDVAVRAVRTVDELAGLVCSQAPSRSPDL